MPSIMDLVREYSELEIKRNQRGGMLDPQSEIRYQALKFFLEFDLFPLPLIKPVEQTKNYERHKPTSRPEIKKIAEEKTILPDTPAEVEEKTDILVESKPATDNIANELASVISSTSLPTDDAMPLPEEKIDPNLNTTAQTSQKEERDTTEKQIKEEVLDMVDAIDEAVQNIVLPEATPPEVTQNLETSPSAPSSESSETAKAPAESIQDNIIDKTDLSTHIDNAFDNVIQLEDSGKIADEVVLENVLPEFPDKSVKTSDKKQEEVLPRSVLDTTNAIFEITPTIEPKQNQQEIDATPVQDISPSAPAINIEELLSTEPPAEESEVSTPQPPINIDEIITKVPTETTPQETNTGTDINPLQIDFLSGVDIATQIVNENIEPKVSTSELPPVSIEENNPLEFIVPESGSEKKAIDRVLLDTPSRAAVHMIDGDARRGVIKQLKESDSEIELYDDETSGHFTKIHISEIKAIFIIKHTGEKQTQVNGQMLNVKFKDDRTISGISTDYTDDTPVFTLYPVETTQSTKMIIVFRGFVDQVEKI